MTQFRDRCNRPVEWWQFFGEAYGLAIAAANRKHRIEAAIKRVGMAADTELIEKHVDYNDEYERFGEGTPGPNVFERTTTLRNVVEQIEDDRWGDCSGANTFADLQEQYRDICDYDCGQLLYLLTVEESEKRERDEKRKKMESYASQFAYSHNVGVNSLEFIEAIHNELERVASEREHWNNPEVRMEQWAACLYAGVGSEVYFDDLNFENGRYDSRKTTLHDLLDWLGEACPLLMAQWNERRAVEMIMFEEED